MHPFLYLSVKDESLPYNVSPMPLFQVAVVIEEPTDILNYICVKESLSFHFLFVHFYLCRQGKMLSVINCFTMFPVLRKIESTISPNVYLKVN